MSYSNYNHSVRRSRLAEPAQITSSANIWTPTADQKNMLGMIFETDDGREFRYQKAGAVALTIGLINQGAAGTANWQNEVQTNSPSIPVAGDISVTVTATATATKDAFADAYLTVEDGTGETNMYIIKKNKAGVANATTGFDIVCEVADAGGIRTAWTTASELTVTVNKFRDVIVAPASVTNSLTGVNLTAVTANWYFWGQTKGVCPVLSATTIGVVGDEVIVAAGSVSIPGAAATDVIVGRVVRAAANGETALIDLNI